MIAATIPIALCAFFLGLAIGLTVRASAAETIEHEVWNDAIEAADMSVVHALDTSYQLQNVPLLRAMHAIRRLRKMPYVPSQRAYNVVREADRKDRPS